MEGPSADLCPKARFLIVIRFSRGPEIRRHRPVSGVSDKRSQDCRRRRLRRLALLTSQRPSGESNGLQKSHFSRPFSNFSRPFSVSKFGIIFGMPFFRHFTPFGAPLAPLWLLLGILGAFWPPFWLPFGSLLLQICIPFSNLVFASILHRFFITFYMPRPTF